MQIYAVEVVSAYRREGVHQQKSKVASLALRHLRPSCRHTQGDHRRDVRLVPHASGLVRRWAPDVAIPNCYGHRLFLFRITSVLLTFCLSFLFLVVSDFWSVCTLSEGHLQATLHL